MKSVGWTLLGFGGSLRITVKSTGCELITLPQSGSMMFTAQAEGVAVGVNAAVGVAVAVEVGVAVAVGVGVAVAVAVGVGVGVGVGCTSNDPTSMRPLNTRTNPGPRWSKKGGGVKLGSPMSMAGLPGNKAWVNVGPPLFCKGPNIGSVLVWSPGPFRKPLPSSLQTL